MSTQHATAPSATIEIPASLRPYVCSIAGTRLISASVEDHLGIWPTPYVDTPADPQTVADARESRKQWRKWDRVIDALEAPDPSQTVTLEKEIALELIAGAIADLKENNLLEDAPTEAYVGTAQALVDLVTLEAGASTVVS